MNLCYREGKLNVVADPVSRLLLVDPHPQPLHHHHASSLLNLTFTTPPIPIAVIPVVGALVAVRLDKTAWLRATLKITALTNADRYGIITKVHLNKQVIVKVASGATRQTSVNRLQAIPLPDYIAALSLPDDAGITMETGLLRQLTVAQDCDSETYDLRNRTKLTTARQTFLSEL